MARRTWRGDGRLWFPGKVKLKLPGRGLQQRIRRRRRRKRSNEPPPS